MGRTIEIRYNGFHGRTTLRFRAGDVRRSAAVGCVDYGVSRAVARRLNHQVCPMDDCRCAETVAWDTPHGWCVTVPEGATVDGMRGRYPQA